MFHFLKRPKETQIDYGIILSVLLLFFISVATLFATTYMIQGFGMRPTIMHIIWYIVGTVAVIVLMHFKVETLWKMTPWIYWGGVLLLVLVLIFYDRNLALVAGARSWFRIGPFTFQPSEVVKIGVILQLSKITTEHNSEYQRHTTSSDWLLIGKIALYSGIPLGLVILQNDFGTMLVYLAIVAGIVLLSGIRWQILLPAILVAVGLGVFLIVMVIYNREFLYNFGFKDYQFTRIDSWLNPFNDTADGSYQLSQAILAIGSGQLFGKGFGISEVHVPVRESDMIFSVIGENFGFIGSAFVLFVYFILIYQMIKVVFDTRNEFYTYIATGVIMMILFHVFENVGMNIGLLPLTGIPLPFISQGGSSLLGNMMGIGLIMSMRYNYADYISEEKVSTLSQPPEEEADQK